MILTRRGLGLGAAGLLATPHIARTANPILIGLVLSVTGVAAESGKLTTNGLNLALG
jgi:hypothetical protein